MENARKNVESLELKIYSYPKYATHFQKLIFGFLKPDFLGTSQKME